MDVALVLQGGGALGAYEYGAVSELVRNGIKPKVVTGVSIGAMNCAAIAGAKGGDIVGSLSELWTRLAIKAPRFIPKALHKYLALYGNPHFYRLRNDWWRYREWTSTYDIRPLYETLQQVVDWDRLNDTAAVRVAVLATNIATGALTTFSSKGGRLDERHIVASGSLPPAFPPTLIDGQYYWDGGLFRNTPYQSLLNLLSEQQYKDLPIIFVNLIPNAGAIPRNLREVRNRMIELSFENRFWHLYGGHVGLVEHSHVLHQINKLVPIDHPLRREREYHRMMEYLACKNVKFITPCHQTMSEGHDFSHEGISRRYDSGVAAARSFLKTEFDQNV
jgi:NTE family protein